jgi:peptidoglycan/xylan/chitin deacetylase (PgdA/CDA1 family)
MVPFRGWCAGAFAGRGRHDPMSKLRHLIAGPGAIAQRGINMLKGPPPLAAFRILLFHDITAAAAGDFAGFLADLQRRHQIITPGEAEAMLGEEPPAGPAASWNQLPVLISFDDGFKSNHDLAAGLLAEAGITALFFVVPELIDLEGEAQAQAIAANIFRGQIDWREIPAEQRLMNWAELRELAGMGHALGAHGMGHRRLSELSGAALEAEITGARARMEDELPGSIEWYAFAFGDLASISAEALAIIGAHYKYCRSGVRGINSAATGKLALLADQIDFAAPASYRNLILTGGLDGRYREPASRLAALAK